MFDDDIPNEHGSSSLIRSTWMDRKSAYPIKAHDSAYFSTSTRRPAARQQRRSRYTGLAAFALLSERRRGRRNQPHRSRPANRADSLRRGSKNPPSALEFFGLISQSRINSQKDKKMSSVRNLPALHLTGTDRRNSRCSLWRGCSPSTTISRYATARMPRPN